MRSKEKRNNFSWCLSVLVWRWNMRRVISQGTVRDVGLAPLICLPAYRVHTQTHTWACTYTLWTRYTIVFILYIIGLFARCVSNSCAGLPVWRLSLFCAFFFVLSISFDVNKLFNLRERHMFFGRGGGAIMWRAYPKILSTENNRQQQRVSKHSAREKLSRRT